MFVLIKPDYLHAILSYSWISGLQSLTFIYFEVTVLVIVEQNLFLVRPGHE